MRCALPLRAFAGVRLDVGEQFVRLERLQQVRLTDALEDLHRARVGEVARDHRHLGRHVRPKSKKAAPVRARGDLEYADEVTMARSLEGRREL